MSINRLAHHSVAVLKVSRPGFWPTQLWFYLLPLAWREVPVAASYWLGAVYVCFPLGLLLYGWNDLGDAATDRRNPRKDSWLFGARPGDALREKLPWIIAAVQLPFIAAFVVLAGAKMLLWFAAVLISNAAYNDLGWKRLPGLDLLNQTGYLLIFVLAGWLGGGGQWSGAVLALSAVFAMQSHLFGQLMDVDEDRAAGRRGTAVTLGVRRSKLLLSAMMWSEAMIAARYFEGTAVAWTLAGGAVFFLLDAWLGPRRYGVVFTKGFFLAWNGVIIATMPLLWR